ncbi:MAG: hypothetical protein KBA81_06605, partial [Rhabdochlamydiaceae bacterium]|nr:hypothetical protein [Rhabdochlamydiaceae bacterium]
MDKLQPSAIEGTEETSTSPNVLQYEQYKDAYEHYRLRLKTTFNHALDEANPAITQQLIALEAINKDAGSTTFYQSDHIDRVHAESKLPFRISSEPFQLQEHVRSQLDAYGVAIAAYYGACDTLIKSLPKDHRWIGYLNHHKPDFLLELSANEKRNHMFLRPDFILNDGEPTVTEIETSPFGLALSQFLNSSFRKAGKDTVVSDEILLQTLIEEMLPSGRGSMCFGITDYTKRYEGQFIYLANLLKAKGIDASVSMMENIQSTEGKLTLDGKKIDALYRCFYLHQSVSDPHLAKVLQDNQENIFPAIKPQLEEKALMAMLWDPEFKEFFETNLGENDASLRKIVPPTWVVDGQNLPSNFPYPISKWEDFASLSRKQRSFVLKTSGFSSQSSWAKGVSFLEKLSKDACAEIMKVASQSQDDIFVIQQFKKGADFHHPYFDFNDGAIKDMKGRVRLTPYYSVKSGKVLTAKATLCENTDYIHAMV